MRAVALLLFLGGFAGCAGTSADPGVDALMQVGAAQFVPGPLPGASGGPAITSLANPTNVARPGQVQRPLGGTLEPSATAVRVGLKGDRGHWLVVAGAPRVDLPGQPTFAVQLSFAHDLARDPVEIELAAVDGEGRVGAVQIVSLALDTPATPQGALVITLDWDRDADLDLRVVDPTGVEIFARNPSTNGGRLDLDSNARCVIDGVRRESVIWPAAAPTGRYVVRVDTPSLCDATSARWHVTVRRDGAVIAEAEGVSTPDATRFDHDLGAGVLALEFSHD